MALKRLLAVLKEEAMLPGREAAMYSEELIERLESELRATLPKWALSEHTELTLLSMSENATFRARDRENGRDIVFRICRPGYHNLVEIASEMAWLAALGKDGVVDTLTPVLQADGDLIADIRDGDAIRHVVAFKFLPGVPPDTDDSLAEWFFRLGDASARLHAHSRQWQRPRGFVRKTWNFDTMLGANPLWGDWRDSLGLTPEGGLILEETADLLRRQLEAYGDGPDRFGLIHADLRLSNVIADGDRLWIVDYDDCCFSWYLYDLAAAISFMEYEPYIPELLDAWVAGYRDVAPLSDEDLSMIPAFIMLRRMVLTAWIASHPNTPTALAMGEDYTHGTVALARAFLAENAEAAA